MSTQDWMDVVIGVGGSVAAGSLVLGAAIIVLNIRDRQEDEALARRIRRSLGRTKR